MDFEEVVMPLARQLAKELSNISLNILLRSLLFILPPLPSVMLNLFQNLTPISLKTHIAIFSKAHITIFFSFSS
jgi:hypothetical protein